MSASTGIPPAADCTPVAEVAAAWVLRRKQGLSNRQEREFSDWLSADSAHRAAFEESLRAWEVAGSAASHPRLLKMRSEALMMRPRRLSRLPLAASLAAIAVISVAGGALLQPWSNPVPDPAASKPGFNIYQTAVGERSTVTLEDGSIVTLNTNSRLRVTFSRGERDLVLLAGQALFQVAHDPARPFIVSALDRQVVATGTEFEVRVDRQVVRVALLQGHVVVRPAGASRTSGGAAPADLVPGDQLTAREGSGVEVARADVEALTSWKEGRVRFTDMLLADAVAEMNRYSHTPIVIEDKAAGEIRISGTFRTGQSQDFAAAVASLFPVEVSQANGQIRLRSAG